MNVLKIKGLNEKKKKHTFYYSFANTSYFHFLLFEHPILIMFLIKSFCFEKFIELQLCTIRFF